MSDPSIAIARRTQEALMEAHRIVEARRARPNVADNGTPEPNVTTPLTAAKSRNPFRPTSLAAVIGQAPAKALLAAAVDASLREGRVLDHILLVGQSGYGKTTLASAIAHEVSA